MNKDLGLEDAVRLIKESCERERERKQELQRCDEMRAAAEDQDLRPKRGGWAPGNYFNKCIACDTLFIGDKRAGVCADCAYKEGGTNLKAMPREEALAYALGQGLMKGPVEDTYVDPAYACAKCGAHCKDVLSPVCYDCRQKMTLVPIKEYKRLQARIEKLRRALGRSANQVRGLKRELKKK